MPQDEDRSERDTRLLQRGVAQPHRCNFVSKVVGTNPTTGLPIRETRCLACDEPLTPANVVRAYN